MRINIKPSRLLALTTLGLALSFGMMGIAAAQEDTTTQKQDQQAPAAGDQQQPQFGPRKKAGQQQGQPSQQQQPPKIDLIAENGQWKVQCETIPATEGQPGGRQCGMIQVTQSEKNPKASLTLVIVSSQHKATPPAGSTKLFHKAWRCLAVRHTTNQTQTAVAANATAKDLVQPAHIFPLQAVDGGVLESIEV